MAASSEAGRSFRQWARQREVEQADQLKQIERAVARIDELDAERHTLTDQVAVALDRLTVLGLPVDQIRLFIGSDPRTCIGGTRRRTQPRGEPAGTSAAAAAERPV